MYLLLTDPIVLIDLIVLTDPAVTEITVITEAMVVIKAIRATPLTPIQHRTPILVIALREMLHILPSPYKVPGISIQPVEVSEETFVLPEVNQNIEVPNGTPNASIMPAFAVPAASAGVKIDAGELHQPPATEKIE